MRHDHVHAWQPWPPDLPGPRVIAELQRWIRVDDIAQVVSLKLPTVGAG
jgi:hypothetical protein